MDGNHSTFFLVIIFLSLSRANAKERWRMSCTFKGFVPFTEYSALLKWCQPEASRPWRPWSWTEFGSAVFQENIFVEDYTQYVIIKWRNLGIFCRPTYLWHYLEIPNSGWIFVQHILLQKIKKLKRKKINFPFIKSRIIGTILLLRGHTLLPRW